MPTRRLLLASLPAGIGLARPALAQERFPARPIRMVIPVGVGGVTDVVGRIMAEGMQTLLGRPVVPENIPGAGSTVGAAAFHRAPADGYAIYMATNNHAVMRAIYPNFPYDPITDFIPLALVGRQPFVLAVHPDVPAQDMVGLLAWLRTRGEAANYGATNPGATNHLAGELFKQILGADFTIIPYRTAANAVQDLVAGRMNFTIDSPTMLLPLIQAGRVRGLAVSSRDPSTLVPGLPSLSQSGVTNYELTAWQVLYAKPGTPPDVVAILSDAAKRALADPGMATRLAAAGLSCGRTPRPPRPRRMCAPRWSAGARLWAA
ncbi:Bug family tripartite tricarboxylate transporter substrate binding protein [Plastoroseomonas arctica]|uniref:Tripartite tricarboxylate transporter substrate binding protein n=1 Tax=Plastoroseomonas arctica TaxID=1509237 RepID=A0AAF1KMK4_9PROT|nr:tripartite tricarboxylate transporter substrate binding protein [Plastoroseomonas arctica]MBR0653563.1 tripartite tricarboxylate transporter substrate binding protein [Plastoroseomonas arctica]